MAKPGFDRIARAYRWMEYLSFGPALARCRFAHLAAMQTARRALILGDGDGRFTARLLACNPSVQVVAVDSSPAMLALLTERVRRAGAAGRLVTIAAEALALFANESPHPQSRPGGIEASQTLHPPQGFDLVVSHFFLDCLSTAAVRQLLHALRPRLAPGATWVVSEFATPAPWAAFIVGSLYRSFRLLAGLRVQQLPAYAVALEEVGFLKASETQLLRGLLVSSVWTLRKTQPAQPRQEATTLPRATSHPAS